MLLFLVWFAQVISGSRGGGRLAWQNGRMTVFVLLTSRCQRSSHSAAASTLLCSAASHSM